jgi:hypothetical protein
MVRCRIPAGVYDIPLIGDTSTAAVDRRDLWPAPRCTLEYQGRKSSTARATTGNALVDAAESRLR